MRLTGATTILALPVAKAAFFDTNTLPLLPIIRGLFVYTFAVAVVVVLIELIRRLAPRDSLNHGLQQRGQSVALPDFTNRRSAVRS
jgi:hypothetical protein